MSSYNNSYLELDKTGLRGSKLKKGVSNIPISCHRYYIQIKYAVANQRRKLQNQISKHIKIILSEY